MARLQTTAKPPVDPAATLLDIRQIAEFLSCSLRHVQRQTDSGQMPRPLHIGRLLRWRARTGNPMTGLHDWVDAGCPSCRSLKKVIHHA